MLNGVVYARAYMEAYMRLFSGPLCSTSKGEYPYGWNHAKEWKVSGGFELHDHNMLGWKCNPGEKEGSFHPGDLLYLAHRSYSAHACLLTTFLQIKLSSQWYFRHSDIVFSSVTYITCPRITKHRYISKWQRGRDGYFSEIKFKCPTLTKVNLSQFLNSFLSTATWYL